MRNNQYRYRVVFDRWNGREGYWHEACSKRFRSLACAMKYADALSERHCHYVGWERHKSDVHVVDAKTYTTVYEAPYVRCLSVGELGYW